MGLNTLISVKTKVIKAQLAIIRDYGIIGLWSARQTKERRERIRTTICLILLDIMIWMVVIAGLQNTLGGTRIVTIEVAQASTPIVEEVKEIKKEAPVAKIEKKKIYTYEELQKMVRDVWGNDADNALKIMACESSNNPSKIGDTDLMYWQNGKQYGDSIGLFQYRTFPNRPDRETLKDPVTNIRLAHELYEARGWYQWAWCYEHRVLNNI